MLTSCTLAKQDVTGFSKKSKKLYALPSGATFSDLIVGPDYHHIFLPAMRNEKQSYLVDDKQSALYDELLKPVFDASGKHYAYAARNGNRFTVIVDGREQEWFDSIGRILVFPDGTVLFNAVRNGKHIIVFGNRSSAPLEGSGIRLAASNDGMVIAYSLDAPGAQKSGLTVCNEGLQKCTTGAPYASIDDVVVSNTGNRIAYIVSDGGGKRVVLANRNQQNQTESPGQLFESIRNVVFSPDGEQLAYVCSRKSHTYIVKGNMQIPIESFENSYGFSIANNGTVLLASQNGEHVDMYVNNVKLSTKQDEIYYPLFNHDGSHYAFVAKYKEKSTLILDGKPTVTYDAIVAPRFLKDNRVLLRARKDNKRFVVLLDSNGSLQKEFAPFDVVFDLVVSPTETHLGYGVEKGNELWWRVETL